MKKKNKSDQRLGFEKGYMRILIKNPLIILFIHRKGLISAENLL